MTDQQQAQAEPQQESAQVQQTQQDPTHEAHKQATLEAMRNPGVFVAPDQPQTPYDSIIQNQNAQIQALIEQNNALTSQITQMIANGTQITQQPAQQTQTRSVGQNWQYQPQSMAQVTDEDMSLEALAREIGKRN